MSKNLIRDWMTPNPITVDLKTTLPETHKLMKYRRIRRLPVMDRGHLVGIVTLGYVREAEPSNATTLSIFELHYLLAKLTIGEIMTREPITISVNAMIREAAKMMLQHKIGGLPVMDDGKLVGIITESDIFRVLAQEPDLTPENMRNEYPKFERATR